MPSYATGTLSMFAGNVLELFRMDCFRQTIILPGRMVCLLHVHLTLESFIEAFVQKFNYSGSVNLKNRFYQILWNRWTPLALAISDKTCVV